MSHLNQSPFLTNLHLSIESTNLCLYCAIEDITFSNLHIDYHDDDDNCPHGDGDNAHDDDDDGHPFDVDNADDDDDNGHHGDGDNTDDDDDEPPQTNLPPIIADSRDPGGEVRLKV